MMGRATVGDVLSKRFFEVDVEDTLSYCQGIFKEHHPRALVVIDKREKFAGMLSERDLVRNLLDPSRAKVRGIYRKAPHVVPSSSLGEAARLMVESDISYLPAIEGGRIVGLITDDAVLKEAALTPYGGRKLDEVMTREPPTVSAEEPIGRAVSLMRDRGISKLPVMTGSRVAGIVTIYDILNEVYSPRTRMPGRLEGKGRMVRPLKDPVSSIMSSPVVSAAPVDTVASAIGVMLDRDISCLVVMGPGGGLLGLLTKKDLLKPIAETAVVRPSVRLEISVKDREGGTEADRERLASMVETFARKHEKMLNGSIVSLYVKTHRAHGSGSRLVHARVTASGPSGQFSSFGEGWESGTAVRQALDNLERRMIKAKEKAGSGAFSERILSEALELSG